MHHSSAIAVVTRISAPQLGVFRGRDAVRLGVSRKQLLAFGRADIIARELPDTYRMCAVAPSREQRLRLALLWAGDAAAAAGRSAGEMYGIEGIRVDVPEIVVPNGHRSRHPKVRVFSAVDMRRMMVRRHRGIRVTGVEATLTRLAHLLDDESFEVACEDARRRRLTSLPALRTYLNRLGGPGQRGVSTLRDLLDQLDPAHPSRSTLEVKTRRLLVSAGYGDFVREFPLVWNGRTFLFDFCFERRRTILETNGRRWHDDPTDYEYDNEKWSVPGRLGYRIVFATWDKVTRRPAALLDELAATLAA